jgi:hypothetical protein
MILGQERTGMHAVGRPVVADGLWADPKTVHK